MYRIRRLTGGEVTLASLDELAAAIAAGTVTADAEIFHQRAERWLPIANHPHFRIAKDRAQSPVRKPTPVPAPPRQAAPPPPKPRLSDEEILASKIDRLEFMEPTTLAAALEVAARKVGIGVEYDTAPLKARGIGSASGSPPSRPMVQSRKYACGALTRPEPNITRLPSGVQPRAASGPG